MKDIEPAPASPGQPQGPVQKQTTPSHEHGEAGLLVGRDAQQGVPAGGGAAAPARPELQPPSPHIPKPPGSTRLVAICIFAVLLICALVLGFIPRWHQRQVAMADTSQLEITTVSVVSPGPGGQETSLMLPAEVQPWRQASVYARANGYLKDWVADIGTHVQAGQLLADIETPDLDQQLREAQAQLNLAQANLHLAVITDNRWQTLLKTASVSIQDAAEKAAAREAADASVQAAKANVERLQDLVSFQRVVAPFKGVVTIRNVDIGDLIVAGSGGKQLFQIAQADKLRAYVRVPETYVASVSTGEVAALTTPENPGRSFAAKVVTTSESISPVSRTLLTELEVDNPKNEILPYSFGEITLKSNSAHPVLTLPSNCILFRAQGLQVGVVLPDNTVEVCPVRIGRDFGQTVELLGGVNRTDRVIVNPSDSLVNGIKVRVQNPAEVRQEN